ncbi:MAG: hypothetical protein KF891_02120 [Rhizobacter sp.]|nr:hypothetical protein [Rhizobacter sp.]
MQKSSKRRVLGVLAAVIASQLMTACVVVPVPAHRRAVIVAPGYVHTPPPRVYHDHDWRR